MNVHAHSRFRVTPAVAGLALVLYVLAVTGFTGCSPDDREKPAAETSAVSLFRECEVYDSDHPWIIIHCMLANGPETRVFRADGSELSAFDALLQSRTAEGEPILRVQNGRLVVTEAREKNDFEDHVGQMLYCLAVGGVEPTRVLWAEGAVKYSLSDLADLYATNLHTDLELAWVLPAIIEAKGLEAELITKTKDRIALEDCLDILMRSRIGDAACAGTHNLHALAFIYNYISAGRNERLFGTSAARIPRYVDSFVRLAEQNQNEDGSFYHNWMFEKKAPFDEVYRLHISGHMLEWIATYLQGEELGKTQWRKLVTNVEKSVTDVIQERSSPGRERKYRIGTLPYSMCAHAVRGLEIYYSKTEKRRDGSSQSTAHQDRWRLFLATAGEGTGSYLIPCLALYSAQCSLR